MSRNLIPFVIFVVISCFTVSCKKCGTCYVAVDGQEEPDTRTEEACGDDYEAVKKEKEDVENIWSTVYPDSDITYLCEDN
ncbi:MAG: hypothetical protein HYZ16_08460 [Bacteroidetes bacterium]|jgi:hypothetical protein|nr:hypothetical protein [Bacteroidota bacterium]